MSDDGSREVLAGLVARQRLESRLDELRRVAARTAALAAQRDRLIDELRAEGVSLRRIATAAGVSHQTIKNMTERNQT